MLTTATALFSRIGGWRTVVTALTALAVAWAAWSYVDTRKENEALSASLRDAQEEVSRLETLREADAKSLATRNQLIEQIKAQEVIKGAEIDKALADNPDWASEPIPDDVLRSLQ